MEQLSFKFMEEKALTKEDLLNEADKLTSKYDEVLRKIITINYYDALNMTVRGDFCDTEFEGTILHYKLQRIAAMLNWNDTNTYQNNNDTIPYTKENGFYIISDIYSRVNDNYFASSPLGTCLKNETNNKDR